MEQQAFQRLRNKTQWDTTTPTKNGKSMQTRDHMGRKSQEWEIELQSDL
jgi:hypothetical protein